MFGVILSTLSATVIALAAVVGMSVGMNYAPKRVITIVYDGGGVINEYLRRMQTLQADRTSIRIDGDCVSACILHLHTSFNLDVCATPRARLGWHRPFVIGPFGQSVNTPEVEEAIKKMNDIIVDGMPDKYKQFLSSNPVPDVAKGAKPSDLLWAKATDFIKECK
ncbi:putative secreted protein [Nostoc phage NMeng1]|nr:putative secreted protein [Nostoc phage NMeng1]